MNNFKLYKLYYILYGYRYRDSDCPSNSHFKKNVARRTQNILDGYNVFASLALFLVLKLTSDN